MKKGKFALAGLIVLLAGGLLLASCDGPEIGEWEQEIDNGIKFTQVLTINKDGTFAITIEGEEGIAELVAAFTPADSLKGDWTKDGDKITLKFKDGTEGVLELKDDNKYLVGGSYTFKKRAVDGEETVYEIRFADDVDQAAFFE